jgi:hypothetical protein
VDPLKNILNNYDTEFLTFFLSIISAIIYWIFRSKVKVIYGFAHNSFNELITDSGNAYIYIEKTYIQNIGSLPAEDVIIVLEEKPASIHIFPEREYEASLIASNRYQIKLSYLSPKELAIIDALALNGSKIGIASVSCKNSIPKEVNFWVVRKFSTAVNCMTVVLLVSGAISLLYLFVAFVLEALQ